jgi:hypothetical protein
MNSASDDSRLQFQVPPREERRRSPKALALDER